MKGEKNEKQMAEKSDGGVSGGVDDRVCGARRGVCTGNGGNGGGKRRRYRKYTKR